MKALVSLAMFAFAIAGCSYHEDTVVRPVPSTAAVVVPDAPPTATVVVPN